MRNSKIRWTQSTWNPWTGCEKVSPGCDRCYAERIAESGRGTAAFPNGFEVTLKTHKINEPLRWKEPRRIFVNSMSDFWHHRVADDYRLKCVEVMERADWHVYQILTKRPVQMRDFVKKHYTAKGKEWPRHIWLGVSVENADYRWRIDVLRQTPCRVRFVSFEPLLGPVGELNLDGIAWAIVGGESGPGFRPMDLDWARDILRQCKAHWPPVAFFFKQTAHLHPERGKGALGRLWEEYPDA